VSFTRPDARHAVLVIEGEIDTLTAGALERALNDLLADPSDVLVVDLSAVTFLASSGLAVLMSSARAVRRPMEITGSDQLFDLYPDRTAALSPAD
jgi:anti-sigma B factor antagonist